MKHINQRQSPRIDIQLHCQVSVPGLCHRSSMTTENISRTGILLAWRNGRPSPPVPRPGQLVTVDVELPAHHGFGRKCIHCQAVVVRVSPAPGAARVALSINYMKFGEFQDNIAALEDLGTVSVCTWLS
jgi:c-di-GMP-binding flagellar brake protein YcgR